VRALAVVHVVATGVVVLATGHHFVLDTLAGHAVVLVVVVLRWLVPGRSSGPVRSG
jgi:hypothetical protein